MELVVKGVKNSYPVIIEQGCLSKITTYFNFDNKRIMIITDSGVPSVYIERLLSQINASVFVFDQGEESKSFDTYKMIIESLTDQKFSRDDVLIALGGGVVGDVTLFAGSTYKRGIKVIMIPTTTLAMCDSSIGGKSAVNLGTLKNVIGTFYDPECVFIDVSVLDTLDKRNFHNGLFEALKMGMISDDKLFDYFYQNTFTDKIEEVITLSLIGKKNIVESDYLEKGIRRALNFGHTIAHALESYSGFSLLHGEAVGYGMLLSITDQKIKEKLLVCLRNLKLMEFKIPPFKELLSYIENDKKIEENYINFISVDSVGHYIIKEVKLCDLQSVLGVE